MRAYPIPPDMNEKEKVIGGIFTLNQFFWLVGGFVIGALVFLTLAQAVGAVPAFIVAFPFMLTGAPFALYKKKGLTLFQYLKLKREFKKKVKKLPNICAENNFDKYLENRF